MKKLTLVVLTLSLSSLAHSFSYDGCYQLFLGDMKGPAMCISGTLEEGIGGGGARLAFFGKNTTEVTKCLHSTEIQMTDWEFEFFVKGKSQIVMKFPESKSSGIALMGTNFLHFTRLQKKFANPLIHAADKADCL